VPADDMMQAFIYHHLVLAESWTVAVQPARWNRRPWTIAADMPVKLTPGETTVLRVRLPGRPPPGRILMQLSDPPEGITIQKVTPLARGLDVTLRADAGKAQAGLRGNLIIDVVVEREPPEKEGQAKTKVRRIPLGPLPALPFEIVSG